MAKNEQTKKDKAVIVVKVIGLIVLMLSALFMVGMLNAGELFVKVLGYGLMVVTLYFALSVVK